MLKNYEIVKKGKIKTKIDNTYVNEEFKMSLTKDEYKNVKTVIFFVPTIFL